MQETKDVVILVAKIGNGLGKALEDGKIGFEDMMAFAPIVAAVPAALAKCTDIPAELAAATDADKEELCTFFCNEFAIPQAKAELMVEKAVEIVVAIWKFIK